MPKTESDLRWDRYFLKLAIVVSMKSKDRSTKCGCIVVGPDRSIKSTGYNGFPPGVDDNNESRHERPEKYFWTDHAEQTAVGFAAKHGTSLHGCTAYVTGPPCADCARALARAGIKRVVIPLKHNFRARMNSEQWKDHVRVTSELFSELGILYEELNYDVVEDARLFYEFTKENYS